MANGLIFNLQRYSVHDGPGIRTTVFLKGCPLRCAWCHNPEGISSAAEIVMLENRCIECEECRHACPVGSEAEESGPLAARQQHCEMCGRCVEVCPAHARQIAGRKITVEALVEEVLRDRVFFEESGGGVTFSGGEPLAQPEFLLAALTECKTHGLHTAVDTCGQARTEHLLAIAPLTDLFLYDIKLMDDTRHQQLTGAPNGLILENLRALSRVHGRIWIRVPLIPGVNDRTSDLEETARFASGLSGIEQVNVLPYHRNGAPKLQRLGHQPILPAIDPPSEPALAAAADVFRNAGLLTRTGG